MHKNESGFSPVIVTSGATVAAAALVNRHFQMAHSHLSSPSFWHCRVLIHMHFIWFHLESLCFFLLPWHSIPFHFDFVSNTMMVLRTMANWMKLIVDLFFLCHLCIPTIHKLMSYYTGITRAFSLEHLVLFGIKCVLHSCLHYYGIVCTAVIYMAYIQRTTHKTKYEHRCVNQFWLRRCAPSVESNMHTFAHANWRKWINFRTEYFIKSFH